MRRQSVAVALCVLVVFALAAPLPSGGAPVASGATDSDVDGSQTGQDGSNNSTLGESVTSFMQVSTVEAASALDRGMWRAAYRRASSDTARARLLAQRLDTLDTRLDTLEARLDDGTDDVGPSALVRSVVLAAEAATLRGAVESTAAVAGNETDVAGFDELQERARGLDAPPVPTVPGAGVADDRRVERGPSGNASGGPESPTGPPDDAGTTGNASDRPGNGNAAGPPDGNAAGPPDGNTAGPPDGDATGPPNGSAPGESPPGDDASDQRPDTGDGPAAGPPENAGNGTDSGGDGNGNSGSAGGGPESDDSGPNGSGTDDSNGEGTPGGGNPGGGNPGNGAPGGEGGGDGDRGHDGR